MASRLGCWQPVRHASRAAAAGSQSNLLPGSAARNRAHCLRPARYGSVEASETLSVGAAAPRLPARRPTVAAAAAAPGDALPEPDSAAAGQQQQQQQQPKQEPQAQQHQKQQQPGEQPDGRGALQWTLAGAAVLAAAAAVVFATGNAGAVKAYLLDGPLGRSGFLAAFSLIFLSEIGDKTFFIAALLAMKLGRLVAFAGSLAALSLMTVISVAIGVVCSRVPDALMTSLPVGEIAGVALLVWFGARALRAAYAPAGAAGGGAEGELEDAQSAVEAATSSGRVAAAGGAGAGWGQLLEVGTLVFLAEWGDRSMLATIALGAAQNPVGVAVGATVGHAAATAIAVVGGAIAGRYVDERTVNAVSGWLFLLFAAATVVSMFG